MEEVYSRLKAIERRFGKDFAVDEKIVSLLMNEKKKDKVESKPVRVVPCKYIEYCLVKQ